MNNFNISVENSNTFPNLDILTIARDNKHALNSPCGGNGTCGKCKVKVVSGREHIEAVNFGPLSKDEIAEGFILACKSKIIPSLPSHPPHPSNSPIEILIPSPTTNLATIPYTENETSEKFETLKKIEPLTKTLFIDVLPPEVGDSQSDIDRLTSRIQKEVGLKKIVYPLSIIQKVATTLRLQDGKVTLRFYENEDEAIHVISIEDGDTSKINFGLAIDIGTTTVAVQLIDLNTKETFTSSSYNQQIECGLDVISRINYAKNPERLQELREKILKTINQLIKNITDTTATINTNNQNISCAVISGNTTMIHLLLALNPEYLRLEPYVPTVYQLPILNAATVGLEINAESPIYFSPAVGSYVGGDITAGVLCTDIVNDADADADEIKLFIDIGTNGEIVAGNKDFLITCACSAGPAFEGGGIKCGMIAINGAIERVEIDTTTAKPTYFTIGNVEAKGICGSGMISLIANLYTSGWLDAGGKLSRSKKSPYININQNGRSAHFILTDSITISEVDIENIIRAKAAIYSALTLLIEQMEITFSEISKVYIAGGFGRSLDIEKGIILGMIPDIAREKYSYIGNSSLQGSAMILLSKEMREKQKKLTNKMTYIDLSSMPSYMNHYSAALFLPHTNFDLFPSLKRNN
ncbi:MAG: DUF4445 domain-containing protein [Oligoflexia bacterium]|nr:DUF4445 domain-containing protein [Oligoflexia bacterium]